MENFKSKYLWLIAPYSLFAGILFTWGYWSTFKINAFEYASINNAIMASLIPISSSIIFLIVGASIGVYCSHQNAQANQISKPPRNNMSKMDWGIFILFFLPSILVFVLTKNEGTRWVISLIYASAIPSSILIKSEVLADITPTFLRSVLLFIVCSLPFYSFASGKSEAFKIINNTEYKFIEIEKTKYKYIGYLQGKTFFTNIENDEILILEDGNEKSMTLKKYKENP